MCGVGNDPELPFKAAPDTDASSGAYCDISPALKGPATLSEAPLYFVLPSLRPPLLTRKGVWGPFLRRYGRGSACAEAPASMAPDPRCLSRFVWCAAPFHGVRGASVLR